MPRYFSCSILQTSLFMSMCQTQWGLASEGYQFQRKLCERHDLTLQPVITYVYLCSLRFKASVLEEGRN